MFLKTLRLNTKKAYTLIEILSTAVLFTIGMMAIFSVFMFVSRTTLVSDKKLLAASKGRQLLEDLRAKIDSRTWSAWNLTCDGATRDWPDDEKFDGIPIQYTCSNQASGARKVTITVGWNE